MTAVPLKIMLTEENYKMVLGSHPPAIIAIAVGIVAIVWSTNLRHAICWLDTE